MESEIKARFQKALKGALDTYHPTWNVRHVYKPDMIGYEQDAPLGVWADTLEKWVKGERFPKPNKFRNFLDKTKFPSEVQANLLQLYSQARAGGNREPDESIDTEKVNETSLTNILQVNKIKKWRNKPVYFVVVLLLVVGGVLIAVFLSNPFPTKKSTQENPRIIKYANSWCAATPIEVRSYTSSTDGKTYYEMYFDGEVILENNNFFVYFRKPEYVEWMFLDFVGLDSQRNQWKVLINGEWITAHPNWSNENLWTLDYYCGN